jgi:glycosyltransferase involved in cell wall biosynthesis
MAEKLPLLIVCDSLPGALTSTGAMVDSLAQEFTRRGFRVTLAGMGSEDVVRAHRWAVYAGGLKSNRLLVRVLTELCVALWLAAKLALALVTKRVERPAVVVVFTPSLFLCLPAAAVKALSGARLYMVQRDIVPDWLVQSGRAKPGPAVSALYALKNFSLRHADHIGIECQENMRFFPERYRGKISVLHNWRDFGRDVHLEPTAGDEVVFFYGGRVGRVQGFDGFLRPFATLRHPRARLKVYCDERGRAEIDALRLDAAALERIEILPMLPEQRFIEEAAKAWYGVVTLSPAMQTHNIPGKMLAYLAAGVPVFVIGPRDAAVGRTVAELDIGWFADAADAQAVQSALQRAIDDPARRTGDRASVVRAREAFSPVTAAQEILQRLGLERGIMRR